MLWPRGSSDEDSDGYGDEEDPRLYSLYDAPPRDARDQYPYIAAEDRVRMVRDWIIYEIHVPMNPSTTSTNPKGPDFDFRGVNYGIFDGPPDMDLEAEWTAGEDEDNLSDEEEMDARRMRARQNNTPYVFTNNIDDDLVWPRGRKIYFAWPVVGEKMKEGIRWDDALYANQFRTGEDLISKIFTEIRKDESYTPKTSFLTEIFGGQAQFRNPWGGERDMDEVDVDLSFAALDRMVDDEGCRSVQRLVHDEDGNLVDRGVESNRDTICDWVPPISAAIGLKKNFNLAKYIAAKLVFDADPQYTYNPKLDHFTFDIPEKTIASSTAPLALAHQRHLRRKRGEVSPEVVFEDEGAEEGKEKKGKEEEKSVTVLL